MVQAFVGCLRMTNGLFCDFADLPLYNVLENTIPKRMPRKIIYL
jgi:hypothetical protein